MDAAPRLPFAFGRFAIDLPKGARLRGRQQALAHLPLAASELGPGETLQSILDRILIARRSLRAPPGQPAVVRSTHSLLPDMVSVIHYDDPDTPESIAMEAVRVTGGTAFTVRGGNTVDHADALEEAAARIGAAIVPTRASDPPEPGFAVDRAVVAMEMHWQESAEAVFDWAVAMEPQAGAGTLSLASQSNADTVSKPLLEKHAIAVPRMLAQGAVVVTLRAGPRVLSDLSGEELVLEAPTGILLQWQHVGEQRSSERPYLSIALELGKGADPGAAFTAWDALLASFRRRRGS
jgi:hypothetical protein